MPSRQPFALAAVAGSLVTHAVLAALLIQSSGEREPEEEPDMVVDMDLDVAPPAPEGFDPRAPSAATLVDEPAAPEAEPEPAEAKADPEPAPATLEPESEEDDDSEEEQARKHPPDAGPEEEQTAAGEARDAGPGDGGAGLASSAPDGGAVSSSPFADTAGEIARGDSTITSGAPETARRAGPADSRTGALPPGASADLRAYSPQGDKIAVLLRYDRLRGTPWAALADAIIAPMPDYRSIVGDRKVALADLFQSLLISSRNPTNVVATNLVARTHLSPAELRRLLDHPLQRVTWQAVRGGVLGRRQHSEVKLDRDKRVYLMPSPGLVVLTRTKHLGALVEPGPSAGSPRADLEGARAAESDLPLWLARARAVENEAGHDSNVIAVVTVGGVRRDEIPVPQFGSLPTPVRFSLALEMAKVGFYVRGTLAFATPELAAEFEKRANESRKQALANQLTQLMLRNLHAFHALKGMTLRRRGQLVTYATSISNADAKAGMMLAADWARRFFETQPGQSTSPARPSGEQGKQPRREPLAPSSGPAAPAAPGPGGRATPP